MELSKLLKICICLYLFGTEKRKVRSTNGSNSGSSSNSTSNAGTERFISRTSSGVSVSSSGGAQDMDVDYKKLYEKETVENERLRKIISDLEKSLENTKLTTKQASGDGCHIVPYNSRLEKLVADLEEENRTLEQIRADNIRLKEENGALIRVISKLSKTK
uniref:cGMP-dependent protein kinase interacting domain-containing protein n=1 Tax=Romanomermis culicivorax TaxID=13658 RepID=A0A915KJH8_ROMCU